MDKRQTIITSLIVVAVLLLGEQVYELVHHDISQAAESKTPAVAMVIPKINPPAPLSVPTYQAQLPPSVIANQQQLITHQQQYVQLMNQYELAKMQRQLLEEEVAIAAARQRIAEINQKTQQLTGQPASSDEIAATTAFAEPTANQSNANSPAYQLAYLDRQGNNYTATLVDHGRYEEVTAGLQLADGSEVKQIDTQGVLLETAANKAFRLTFNGVVPVEENTVIAPDNLATANKAVTAPTPATEKNIIATQAAMITPAVKHSLASHHVANSNDKQPLKKHSPAINTKPSVPIASKKNQELKQKINKRTKIVKSPTAPKTEDFNNLSAAETTLFNPSHALKISPIHHKTPAIKPSAPIHLAIEEVKTHKPNRIKAYTLDEILLLELPPTSYTIELKGAYSKHDLIVFARQQAIGENAIYYSMPREHKTWHVLLYSYFNTKTEAEEALSKLPSPMLAIHPKIQSITDIQQGIKTEKQ